MRLVPIIVALFVTAALYMIIFERDQLLDFAGSGPSDQMAADGSDSMTDDASASDAMANAEDAAKPDTREGLVSVVAIRSLAQVIDNAVVVRGETQADRQVEVRSETSGLIISDPLRKGTFVDAGQVLCQVDPGTREASLLQAKASLAEAEARLPERNARVAEAESVLAEAEINDRAATKLIQGGFASETRLASTNAAVSSAKAGIESARSGVEAARSGIEAAKANVALAEKEIDRLTIKAPFSGLLETDTAELGALLQPGSACATIIQLNPIKLVGFVPETEVQKIALGAMAQARIVSGRMLQGGVTYLSRSSDPTTRTFRVEISVDNSDMSVRDGQTAEIAIQSDGASAHLVPQSALTLNDAGDLGVRVVRETDAGPVASFVPVVAIRDSVEGMYVTGLDEEADVIVVGQEYVTDGVPIAVTYRADQAEVTQ